MPSNKDRLYLALYARGGVAKMPGREDTYVYGNSFPIRQGEEACNCVLWVKEALDNLERSKDVIGTCVLDWESVREAALSYCQKKKDQHRFDGKGKFDTSQVPTYDLIQGKETIA